MIDFDQINQAALARLHDLLPELLPGGRLEGREYRCGDLTGKPGQSLSVNTVTGEWGDFATEDKGGDLISLVAAIRGVSQVEAARWLGGLVTRHLQGSGKEGNVNRPTSKVTKDTWISTPTDTPPQSFNHPTLGIPSAKWEYRGPTGEVLGYACRFDRIGKKKVVIPFTHGRNTITGETGWRWRAFSEPRPPYGQDRLARQQDIPALVVEGEKTTDAAQRLIPGVVAITWSGGSGAVAKTDFGPMKGRSVVIWPDNDAPGRKAAETVARAALEAGAAEVYVIEPPPNKAEGWDLADAEAEGWTQGEAAEWIKNNKRQVEPGEADQSPVSNIETAQSSDWPEPLPLIVHHQSDPYPIHALPGTIGAALREVVDFVQCPVALGACSVLSVASTVTQGLVDVRRARNLEGPSSLYILAIADSGERKSSVDGHFKKPVEHWESEKAEEAKPYIKKFEVELEAWDAKKSGLLAAIKEATKHGESTTLLIEKMLILEAEKPVPPKIPRLLFGDTTPEALAYQMAHVWPVGGVLSSEAGTVFGSHAMSKDSAMRNMALLNSFWSAEPLTIDRKTSQSFTVRGARLTMGLAVQSEAVRTFLDSNKGLARGMGWLARFLIAWPESTQGDRPFKEPPEHWPHLAKFHRRLGALLDLPLTFNELGELKPKTLELSPEAKAVWVAFHDDVEAELRPGREMAEAKDVASKAADNAARLAALFHLFEDCPGDIIGPDHMKMAAAVAGWHLYEARRFIGEIGLPIEMSNAAKLDAWLLGYYKQNPSARLTTRNIQRLGPNCTREKRALESALEELKEAGRVRVEEDGRSKLIRINPALLGG